MTGFQDSEGCGRPGQGTPAGTGVSGVVHQVVFRWDGNHGRQSTGMTAVSHSCSAERAEQLGRELGPLLWVSGTEGPRRPSFVRTLSRDGDIMLAQRWPTTDRSGRPSTVSHVLIGDSNILKTRLCLGLTHGGWENREKVEGAAGTQRQLTVRELQDLAGKRLPAMLELLPTVRDTLMLVTAEWLRDPAQRISLLTDEVRLPDRPDQDAAPLVYLGLFMLFGPWLGREWTFATYDTLDTHPLRLTCVPRWEPDTGESGPLARVIGRMSATPRYEHKMAVRLVDHVLAHPAAPPGVPHLVEELPDGAALDWTRRRDLLTRILSADRRPTAPARSQAPPPRPEPRSEPRPERRTEPRQETWQPSSPSPSPVASPAPVAHDDRTLHEVLRSYRHNDPTRRDRSAENLSERLRDLPDEHLVNELCSGVPSSDAVELLLRELGGHGRRHARRDEVRHRLCAEVLRNDLYLTPNGPHGPDDLHRPGNGLLSRTESTQRAADLFAWAVAPLARDERYLRDLGELLHRMSRDRPPTAVNWLRQAIIQPADGVVPDLPPALWQQILRDVISQKPSAATVRSATPTAAPTAGPSAAPTASRPPVNVRPAPPPARMPPLTLAARLSDFSNSPGCVLGVAGSLIVIFITTALLLL
ncbi:hypothetical protein [Streptomyces corynorhini]|uniref:Uncharacterized protein n=1 Tax=Streptomyces corynorhini TaxID=2282652 RepID=A0A370BCD6_9ACTN|nr:hypothetical protein [Streptomyces corynorhini]RDG37854.1 hypothetical protein DVH02_12405 [Streptomyces corynorhini]